MAGFGKTTQNKKTRNQKKPTEINAIKGALDAYQKGDLVSSKNLLSKEIKAHPKNSLALGLLATIEKSLGNKERAIELFEISISINQNNPDILHNYSGLLKDKDLIKAVRISNRALAISPENSHYLERNGYLKWKQEDLKGALEASKKAIELNPYLIDAHIILGGIHKDLGELDQALAFALKSLELKPDNPDAHINIGSIYQELGNLDQAYSFTLKSLDLKPDNPDAYMNLGGIYKDLGNLDQALASNLKSLELKPDHLGAASNIKAFIDQLKLSPSNAHNVTKTYELLINQTDISHCKLNNIFLQAFLPTIQKASTSNPIISDSNEAFKILAADWRFRKSLTLMIPPSSEAERFFTRLRKELLMLTIQKGTIPTQLKPLTEVLAAQCFLNEYVYYTSQEEEENLLQLIHKTSENQEAINQNIAIIGCYKAIHTIGISPRLINKYPTPDDSSKELITAQFKDPREEKEIKTSFHETRNITNEISQRVQEMYEENPYPRFKYSDFTAKELAKPSSNCIRIETTRKNLTFPKELSSLSGSPKILIAGCGTGDQVIASSRYKNAKVTAIDISKSSLAYAIKKTKDYAMEKISFNKMDLLNVSDLEDVFDIIECGGVLHHMEKPDEGLSALVQQLKPGGYIKLGLYSEIARKVIVETRKIIKTLGITSTPESIRMLRNKVLSGEIQELIDLPKFGRDFYSLSECRDLCFHVQEHRYTTEKLQRLIGSHGLTFCGFILPDQVKKIYKEQYPEDIDMTSLTNWGNFEKDHPSTFKKMYQFWTYKPT